MEGELKARTQVSHRACLLATLGPLALVLALAPSGAAIAAGGDRDCADFASQKDAQEFFIANGGPQSDPHRLDGDGDGAACEANPCPCSTSTGGGGGGGGEPPAPEAKKQRARVIEVIDGDTIRVNVKNHVRDVRLIGIDTPEVYGGAECGGSQASESMKRMLDPGDRVRLISDPTQDNKDRYRRLLRYVETGGKDLNRKQVRRGWAHVYVYAGVPFRRVEKYRSAQSDAKQHGRGAWGLCNGHFRQER